MGIFSNLFPRLFKATSRPSDHDDFWYEAVGASTMAGVHVTPDSAMQVSAVLACVFLIANTIASLPLVLYRRFSDDERERASDLHLYRVLKKRPNVWQSAYEYKQMMCTHLLLRGNAYARIMPGPHGAVDQLVPLHPDRVRPKQLDSGRIAYEYQPVRGPAQILVQDEIHHLRVYSSDGISGLSPIDYQRETIGGAIAAQQYGQNYFGNYAQAGLFIKHPQSLSDTARDNLTASFDKRLSGRNRFKTAVLEEGMDVVNVGLTNEQAQFLQTKRYNSIDIARIFLVPPTMIGEGEKGGTQASNENQGRQFLSYTLNHWLVLWEQAVERDLIVDDETYFAEFLTQELLRGDILTRYRAYAVARQWGWMSPNMVLRKENEKPRKDPGGDAFLDPANMFRSDQPKAADPSGLVDRDGKTDLSDAQAESWSWDSRRPEPEPDAPPTLAEMDEHENTNGYLH